MGSLLLFLGLGTAIVLSLSVLSARRRLAAFRGREPLSIDEIFSRYFAGTGLDKEAFERHWVSCAGQLRISAQLLRPSDRFDLELKSLGLLDTFDGSKDDLARHARAEAMKNQRTVDLAGLTTFGDLVVALVRLEEGGRNTGLRHQDA